MFVVVPRSVPVPLEYCEVTWEKVIRFPVSLVRSMPVDGVLEISNGGNENPTYWEGMGVFCRVAGQLEEGTISAGVISRVGGSGVVSELQRCQTTPKLDLNSRAVSESEFTNRNVT